MLSIIIVLTILYGWKFIREAKKDFFQLNYEWKNEEVKNDFGEVFIDSISYNYLKLTGIDYKLDNQKTYKLSLQNKRYYFRYVYNVTNSLTVELSGLEWITDIPKVSKAHYRLEEVSLPLKHASGPTVLSLGDEQLFENEAKYFRRDLLKRYPVNFKGGFRDVFNFSYQANKGNTSADLLNEIQTLANTDFYILFFGLSENMDKLSLFEDNTKKILRNLQNKNPKKIILITLPPSKDKTIDSKHKKLNEIFQSLAKEDGVELIDTYSIFSTNIDKFIRNDNSISRDGYFELAKLSAKILKNAN